MMAVSNSFTARQKPKFSVAIQSDGYKKLINNTLGDPKRAQRFIAAVSSAVGTNPDLQECDAGSILTAALLGEGLNLSPSPQLGQYYLVPYKINGRGKVAQFQIGYKGLIDLSYRNPQIQMISAHEVYENDEFDYELGLYPRLVHRPVLEERGEVRLFYGFFRMINGGFGFEVMSRADMDAYSLEHSESIESSFSPWKDSYVQMAKKTVIKKALKYAPLKSDFRRALSADETIKTELCEDMSEIPGGNIFDAEYREPGRDTG